MNAYLLAAVLSSLPLGSEMPGTDLEGTWLLVGLERNGKLSPCDGRFPLLCLSEQGRFSNGPQESHPRPYWAGTFRADPTASPKSIDFFPLGEKAEERTIYAIYRLYGDELQLYRPRPGTPRPRAFTPDITVEIWRRYPQNLFGIPATSTLPTKVLTARHEALEFADAVKRLPPGMVPPPVHPREYLRAAIRLLHASDFELAARYLRAAHDYRAMLTAKEQATLDDYRSRIAADRPIP